MIKLSGLSVQESKKIIPENTILLGYRGSIAHGTYVPQEEKDSIDDKDILGVCIPPLDNYFGLNHFEQKETKYNEWDSVVYEIRKMFRLLIKSNPNVLCLLWLEPCYYIHISKQGQTILDNRDLFVSKLAYHSFSGYAHGQLHRMTSGKCLGYMGKKRKTLVEKYGYDCKNASHLIRLLRMGIEYLTEGHLNVMRADAEELKEIKKGMWTLERVRKEADRLFALAEEAYVRSILPPKIDTKKITDLLMNIMEEHFGISKIKKIQHMLDTNFNDDYKVREIKNIIG